VPTVRLDEHVREGDDMIAAGGDALECSSFAALSETILPGIVCVRYGSTSLSTPRIWGPLPDVAVPERLTG
jgi:hypothetical protein